MVEKEGQRAEKLASVTYWSNTDCTTACMTMTSRKTQRWRQTPMIR